MAAITEEPESVSTEPLKVLFCMHPNMDAMDMVGPLEVFHFAWHDKKDKGTICYRAPTNHTWLPFSSACSMQLYPS